MKQQDLINERDKFSKDAMGYLLKWIKKNGKRPFSAEEVTMSALLDGVAPKDLRHWGGVFQQAARDGYIRRSDKAFRRSMGNSTLTLGWVAI